MRSSFPPYLTDLTGPAVYPTQLAQQTLAILAKLLLTQLQRTHHHFFSRVHYFYVGLVGA